MASKTDIAKALLGIKAVFLRPDEPFTWASGIQSPIYCDNRLTLSYPEVRTLVDEGLAALAKERYPEMEALMGTSTAGIAHAAIAADRLGIPMGYVRGSAKDHGRKNQIECVEVLRAAGAQVLGIVSIFTYGMAKSAKRLGEAQVQNASLCDLDTLVKVAVEEGYIQPADEARLLAFRDNPSDTSWMNR